MSKDNIRRLQKSLPEEAVEALKKLDEKTKGGESDASKAIQAGLKVYKNAGDI